MHILGLEPSNGGCWIKYKFEYVEALYKVPKVEEDMKWWDAIISKKLKQNSIGLMVYK